MKCLVTGGAGFIGSHVVERLLDSDFQVIVIDNESAPENNQFFWHNDAINFKADIRDEKMHWIYKDVDIVFHLAARSRIQPSLNKIHHTFDNNTMGTLSVLEACLAHGVKRVVYSASSSVYGIKNPPPHKESMQADCLNPYSVSKYQGEQICELFAKLHRIEIFALRYFNVYGPREPLNGVYAPVIGIFKRQKLEGKKLTVVGTGEQRRDFTHVYDVAHANFLAGVINFPYTKSINDYPFETINIGTGTNYSVNQIAEMVGGESEYIAARPQEANVTLADNSKALSLLGWFPTKVLEEEFNSY